MRSTVQLRSWLHTHTLHCELVSGGYLYTETSDLRDEGVGELWGLEKAINNGGSEGVKWTRGRSEEAKMLVKEIQVESLTGLIDRLGW